MSLERMQSKRALQIQCVFGTGLREHEFPDREYVFAVGDGVDYVGVEMRCVLQCETYWPDGVRQPGLTDNEKRDIADTCGEFARAQARRMLGLVEFEAVRHMDSEPSNIPELTYRIEMAQAAPKYLDPHTASVVRHLGHKVRMRTVPQGTNVRANLHQDDDELPDGEPAPTPPDMRTHATVRAPVTPEQVEELRQLMSANSPMVLPINEIQASLRPVTAQSRGTNGPEPHQRSNSRRIARDSNGSEESEVR